MRPRLQTGIACWLLFWSVLIVPAMAQVPTETKVPPVTPVRTAAGHDMTPADMEAFFDGLLPYQLAQNDAAGAVIVVVKNGQVVFQKGYGYSDAVKKTTVTVDQTLFRVGSISKLFTWTAVMQLVEQGKINLDEDVNRYLDFQIPATYAKPITMHNLMTHTAGFSEVVKDLLVHDEKHMFLLGDYCKQHLPRRIFAPGIVPAYSNYGATLAGYIVQRVSGQPFDDYVEQHILQPLKMSDTTTRQPLPSAFNPLMSKGYQLSSQPPKLFEFVVPWPAGSVSSTGADMAHFMLAHLQNGNYENAQILRPETAKLMQSRQYAYDPRLNGMCLGFYEESRNGHRIIGHGGDTDYFHSDLHLVPDANLGFFLSYNSAGKDPHLPRMTAWEDFLDRYFPYTPPAVPTVPQADHDSTEVAGSYVSSRRSEGTILDFFTLLSQTKVTKNPDGTISAGLLPTLSGPPKHFREIGPMLFREVGGQDTYAFERDPSGRLVLCMDWPIFVFQQTPLRESIPLNVLLVGFSMIVFLLILLGWPIAAVTRRHYGKTLALSPRQRRLRMLVRLTCGVNIVFVLCWVWFISTLSAGDFPTGDLDPALRVFQAFGYAGILGAIVTVYAELQFVRNSPGWWFKVYNAAAAVACVIFVWFLFNWHMLQPSLRY